MNFFKIRTLSTTTATIVVAALCVASTSIVLAATLAQEFNTTQRLPLGGIVSLNKEASEVELASSDNMDNLYGVIVANGDVSFDSRADQNISTVPVANSGVIDTLVSNNTGAVKAGDPITVDDVAGVGQKANSSGRIIGIAQSDLNEQDNSAKQVSIVQNGGQKYITVNTVQVKIGVAQYTVPSANDGSNGTDTNRNKVLQVADSLAGKQVKPYSVVIAALLLLIGIFVSVFLITSSGYASMISIGRNPLSEKKIIRSLLRMLVISVAIFATTVGLAYMVLRLI